MNKLEDNHEDIIAKAMRGQNVGKAMLAKQAEVKKSEIELLLEGEVIDLVIQKIAPVLKLDSNKLLVSARKSWEPKKREVEGVMRFESTFGSMLVNAYLIFDENSKEVWIFDTGTKCELLLKFIEEQDLKVDSVFLTHTHLDHIYCLDSLKDQLGGPDIFVHKSELVEWGTSIDEGFKKAMGSLNLSVLHTHGHSVGGMTYLIDGLSSHVAIVGDALFAGSMGGGMVSYADALRNNRQKLMTLPDETIVCPGHGPMTTIGEEKQANPFFPEFSVAI